MSSSPDARQGQAGLSSVEQRAVVSLASLYALRMLGLFMVLPVMMLEGQKLEGATPALLGLAMGVYGLTQALLQIPAGTLSDRIGRKPIIIGGLLVFAAGSLLAASADSVWGVIAGRALQGGGAIASAIMALVTDLTREENRMKAMASIGASIGLSFSVALVLGPWLAGIGGLSLIFGLTGALAIGGVLVTLFVIPNPPRVAHRDSTAVWSEVARQFVNPQLWPLNLGIFLLHSLMVAIFVAIPGRLLEAGLVGEHHSWLYLPVLVVAFILMVPFIIVAEKKRKMKSVVITGALVIAVALLSMSAASQLWHWVVLLLLYFWGFNLMEASLPSWLSKVAPAGAKGSAMGIYSSMQFLGAFSGGSIGGYVLSHFGSSSLFVGLGALVILWTLILSRSSAPLHLTSVRLPAPAGISDQQLSQLLALTGVAEVSQMAGEGAVYLKVSADAFDREQALVIIESTGEKHGSQR
ncbi:MFS transporter [Thalassolituus sp. LLYu03]|uniref:MFS transporter n=1 Tax=Thalassolituus sp. LLYu03 TaxID=3421656 RepID=UPI003D29D0FA